MVRPLKMAGVPGCESGSPAALAGLTGLGLGGLDGLRESEQTSGVVGFLDLL
jgi:hypothetical protein